MKTFFKLSFFILIIKCNFGKPFDNDMELKKEDLKYIQQAEKLADVSSEGKEKETMENPVKNDASTENCPHIGVCDGESCKDIIPFCSTNTQKIIYISTMDGAVTAIDFYKGYILWSHNIGGPLVSSTLSKIDISSNGEFIHLLPSLTGQLYKFDGERIEPLPFSADLFLHSSFKFSGDTVVSGSKNSEVSGLVPDTGEVKFVSGPYRYMRQTSETNSNLLLLRRDQYFVHAISSKSGQQKWNFSVGQPSLSMSATTCKSNENLSKYLRFVIPEAKISFIGKESPWEVKLDSPIAGAWLLNGDISEIDLFSKSFVPALESPSKMKENSMKYGASLYVGMHNDEYYIQESEEFRKRITSISNLLKLNIGNLPKFNVEPYLARDDAKTQFSKESRPTHPLLIDYECRDGCKESDKEVLPGLYHLFHESLEINESVLIEDLDDKAAKTVNKNFCYQKNMDVVFTFLGIPYSERLSMPFMLFAVGMSSFAFTCYWYKHEELKRMGIKMMQPFANRILYILQNAGVKLQVENEITPPIYKAEDEPYVERQDSQSSTSSNQFVSRVCSEFDNFRCLGKGGFGVVFHAHHKIDDSNYAIKRINLCSRKGDAEKALREVQALAKLTHPNIVRYYNSWHESPPVGWTSELEDHMQNLTLSTYGYDSETDIPLKHRKNLSFTSSLSQKLAVVGDTYDDDSSFIQFEASEKPDDSDGSSIVFEQSQSHEKVVEISSYRKEKREYSPKPNMFLYIQMELCQNETLREWLSKNNKRNRTYVLNVFNDILHAVEYIHERNLIHRDLKPSNIFFSFDGKVKVGDFGLVTHIVDDAQKSTTDSESYSNRTQEAGTEIYMSPEQRNGKNYNHKVDIYSLGMIFFEMLHPFGTEMERRIVLLEARKMQFDQNFKKKNPEEVELIKKMLDEDPDARYTTKGIRCSSPLRHLQTDLSEISDNERHVLSLNKRKHRKSFNDSR